MSANHSVIAPLIRSADVTALALSVPEAGERLGVGTTKAWELVRTGELPSIKLGGRRIVRVAAIEAMLDRLETAQANPR